MLTAWSWVSIGTSDVAAACHFWVDMLGFECIDRAEGDDPGLRQHWQLTDRQIRRQVMLRSPGAACGAIHLVEYDTAAATVRQDAAVFDLCPKNLDIYVDDLPLRMAELTARGVRFRNEQYSEALTCVAHNASHIPTTPKRDKLPNNNISQRPLRCLIAS